MAQTPEKKVKDWLKRELKKLYPDIFIYMAPGGAFGMKGIPDLLCCTHGIFVAIEVKANEKGKATDMQVYQMRKLSEAGAVVALMKGKDIRRLKLIEEAIHRRIRKADY